jgi:hypothetical protein
MTTNYDIEFRRMRSEAKSLGRTLERTDDNHYDLGFDGITPGSITCDTLNEVQKELDQWLLGLLFDHNKDLADAWMKGWT